MTISQYAQVGFAFFVIATLMQLMPELVFAVSNATVAHQGNVGLFTFLLGRN